MESAALESEREYEVMQTIKTNVFYSVHSAVDGEQKKTELKMQMKKLFARSAVMVRLGEVKRRFQNQIDRKTNMNTEALPRWNNPKKARNSKLWQTTKK